MEGVARLPSSRAAEARSRSFAQLLSRVGCTRLRAGRGQAHVRTSSPPSRRSAGRGSSRRPRGYERAGAGVFSPSPLCPLLRPTRRAGPGAAARWGGARSTVGIWRRPSLLRASSCRGWDPAVFVMPPLAEPSAPHVCVVTIRVAPAGHGLQRSPAAAGLGTRPMVLVSSSTFGSCIRLARQQPLLQPPEGERLGRDLSVSESGPDRSAGSLALGRGGRSRAGERENLAYGEVAVECARLRHDAIVAWPRVPRTRPCRPPHAAAVGRTRVGSPEVVLLRHALGPSNPKDRPRDLERDAGTPPPRALCACRGTP